MKTKLGGAIVLAAGLAACGGGGSTDVEPTLRFADRTDAEIARLISAASGADMFMAQSQVEQFGDPFEPDPCPAIGVSGDTVTLTGGCTTAGGMEIQGGATLINPHDYDEYTEWEYGEDTTYELHGLTFVQSGFSQSWTGVVDIAGDFRSWDADITTTQLGVTVRSDLYYSCGTSSCSLSGSGIELIGAGGARVSGRVELDGEGTSARYTLEGVDTLQATVEAGCVAWEIEDSDRRVVCAQ